MFSLAAGELALQRKSWSEEEANRQRNLIKKAGLPIEWPDLDQNAVLETLQGDKKVINGLIRFIIPSKIGEVEISNNISEREIRDCLSRLTRREF